MAAEAGDVATAPLDEAAILEPPVDQTVIELLAARLAQPSEGNASPTGTGSLAEGATPNVTGDAEAALLAAELALEPQEPLFYARLEQCPFPEDGTGASFLLDRPYCVIGRRTAPEDPVHVSIDSTKVSRRHARIQFNHNIGAYELLVWGRNGAFIEYPEWYEGAPEPDRKIFTEGSEMPQPVPLVHDSVIVIGGTRLRFLLPDPPEIALRGKSKGKKRKLGQMSGGDSDSDDPNREQHQKPPYPYSYLIAQAILSSPQKKLTLNAIYQEISARYPYFRMDVTGWQNSVRHNLSLNKAFVKVKRPENEPGKGAFWMVAEGTEPMVYRRKSSTNSGGTQSESATPGEGAAEGTMEGIGEGGEENPGSTWGQPGDGQPEIKVEGPDGLPVEPVMDQMDLDAAPIPADGVVEAETPPAAVVQESAQLEPTPVETPKAAPPAKKAKAASSAKAPTRSTPRNAKRSALAT